jgi:low temperature requirement protein LtrA
MKQDGRSLAVTALMVLALGVTAWLVWVPISDHLHDGRGPFGWVVLSTFLATTWVVSVQSLLFSLIPLKFLDGEKVVTWNRLGWFAIYLLGMFVFVEAIMHPQSDKYGGNRHADLHSMLLLFVSFMVVACLFWLYFRIRTIRHKEESKLEPARVEEHQP